MRFHVVLRLTWNGYHPRRVVHALRCPHLIKAMALLAINTLDRWNAPRSAVPIQGHSTVVRHVAGRIEGIAFLQPIISCLSGLSCKAVLVHRSMGVYALTGG